MTYTYSELAALMGSLTATSNDAIVEQAYLIVAGREADASGKAYWVARLEDDLTPETLIAAMIRGAEAYKENNPGEDEYDIDTIAYKELAAIELSNAGLSADDIASALIGVTDLPSMNNAITEATGGSDDSDEGTSFTGIIAASTGGVVDGTDGADTIYMSAAQDFVLAGAGNDTIVARGNGSLDNADVIDGGADTDTIEVMLDAGETAESPLVMNVEILKVQAQAVTTNSGDNDVDTDTGRESNIDAGDMSSVQQYWSEDSRADLVIEDISRNSHITTIGMRETDPDVNYAVYFDPENITKPGSTESGATLLVKMANVLQVAEGGNPIENFTQFSFSVDTTNVVVDVSEAEDYDDVVDAIEAAAAEAGLDVTVEKQAATEAYFSIDITGSVDYNAGDLAGTYNPILITNNGAGSLVKGSFATAEDATDAAYTNSMSTGAAATTPALTQVDVIFDRVGKNSQGGDFVAGSDSTGDSGSAGIQQFNIDVDRDSWLEEISSTNDTLEVVNVENIEEYSDGKGSLKVDLIENIRVFDGSTMEGDADITVTLDESVTAKYLNLVDENSNPAADNSEDSFLDVTDIQFSYDFGSGDDSFDLTLDTANLAAAGTTTREDFVMEIRGGEGDDSITTILGNGAGLDTDNWYKNSVDNGNLEIDAGSGNDTITTTGAGNFTIDAGAGNDTIYADNSGAKAKWVVGAENVDINDLDGQTTGAMGSRFLVNGELTVSFIGSNGADADSVTTGALANPFSAGYEVTVDIPTGVNYTVTQLHINQAIKEAINSDAVLSKLLVAQDGPSNTLVITSLIDGTMVKDNLEITVAAADVSDATIYTASEQTAILSAYESFLGDSNETIAAAQVANAASVVAANGTNGLGVDGAIFAQQSTTSTITIGGAADAVGSVVATIDGTSYTYTFASADTATEIAGGLNAVLNAAGVQSTFAAGVVTVVSNDVNAVSTDATAAATVAAAAAANITGADSTANSDNVIEGSAGNDVIVLGTDTTDEVAADAVDNLTSNDTVVFADSFGTDTIVNFTAGALTQGNGADKLDFTDYLTTKEYVDAVSTSTVSQATIATTLNANAIVEANSVTVVTFDSTVNVGVDTFDKLDASTLFDAIKSTNAGADDYANFTDAFLDVADGDNSAVTAGEMVGTSMSAILMVQNDLNEGEYKVFELTASTNNDGADDTGDDFTAVTYVGTIDFGDTVTLDVTNLV